MNKEEKVTISIITVCLNAVNTIEKTINSVISQSYPYIEYIIIDGLSTDGTLDIINKYKDKITHLISEKDNGIYDAMNKGIKFASGKFVYFLGGDDILNTDIIREVEPYLNSNSKTIYYGQVILKPQNKLYGKNFSKYKLLRKNLSHQSIFYPQEVFLDYSFNCKYKISADWDLNLKLVATGWYFKYINLIIAEFNTQGVSSKVDAEFLEDRKNLVKMYFGIKELLFYEIYKFILKFLEDLILIKNKFEKIFSTK